MPDPIVYTPAQQLESILTQTDRLAVSPNGDLMIEGMSASQLLDKFGSPLYVFSENTLRDNFRRIRSAFTDVWPGPVNIMYAIKANTNLAVRAILHQECAGGDCFSEGEIHATFKAGAEADKIALNGGNKPEICLRIAVEKGITINIDAESEIDRLREICRSLDKQARVNIRLKPLSDAYNQTPGDYFGGDHLADYVRRTKWGFSVEKARELINRIRSFPLFDLSGFSCHIGRITRDPLFFHHYGRAVGGMVTELHGLTGFAPRILDIGGGWARERDPESKSLATNTTPAEVSARATCGQILTRLEASGLDVPELWVEPGRFIVGNASVLLATVGTVKHDLGLTWVHIDASTNDLPRIDTSGSAYHVLAASGMLRKFDGPVDVVGPICIDSTMGRDIHMPEMVTGEPVAILDAGMYSESASTQFNSIPRPATVLVNGQTAEIIKEREQISDIFRHHRIPERLL